MESIDTIGTSIKEHVVDEYEHRYDNKAIARVYAKKNGVVSVFWLTNNPSKSIDFGRDFVGNINCQREIYDTSKMGGQPVYKNTKMGRALIESVGKESGYDGPTGKKISVKIENRAVYTAVGRDAKNVEIAMDDSPEPYLYERLGDLLERGKEEIEKKKKEQNELQKIQEQQALLEKQNLAEEERRLEEERLEREKKEREDAIAQIEENLAEINNKLERKRAFLRTNVALRSQHILDPFQEDAKRSHIYDGVPLIIDGGPGTGKTTTVIQRLKFLLSKESLEEYGAPLTKEQLESFADPNQLTKKWLFFSPTVLLLDYLKDNMQNEGLVVGEDNCKTIERFRHVKMREYGIIDPSNRFRKWSDSDKPLVTDPQKLIKSFGKYCVDEICERLRKCSQTDISQYAWKSYAEKLKNVIERAEINDVGSLFRTLDSLNLHKDADVNPVEDELKSVLDDETISVTMSIEASSSIKEDLLNLFREWKKEKHPQEELEDDAGEIPDDEVETPEVKEIPFEIYLNRNVRRLLRSLGLKYFDENAKLTKRQQALYEKIKNYINDEEAIKKIGEFAWFSKRFATICRGVESIWINQLPRMYKNFRKVALQNSDLCYDCALLKEIVSKDSNKHLHVDEQNFLLGFINKNLFYYSKISRPRFESMKGKIVSAYKASIRPIIGIDEATDYTLLDYYCMISFKHYAYSTITLSGDVMQGLNDNGIKKWEDLKDLFPNIDVKTLKISYRQTPTLVEMAKEMYKDETGSYPSYESKVGKHDGEARPILFCEEDALRKAEWISERINDIYKNYGSLPSIAIFVGDDVNVKQFIDNIEDAGILNGIEVVDCTDRKMLDGKEVVRVFRLTEIKGMEFEAAFFYDIDTAVQNHSENLIRRYLYVGVSRAVSHLAATMTTAEGNESLMKYFEIDSDKWNW